ncbi:MAG: (d)CMP kinase, partial [Pseudomonadota bacterium]
MPDVRAALFSFQKRFARREGGAVLDGRDICTVIAPEAEVKLFVTASDAARAHRRWLELTETGHSLEQADVLAQLQERDRRDAERDAAPMVAAEDAVVLDTSDKSIDQAVAEAIALIERRYQRET